MGTGFWNSDQSQRTSPYLERYPGYVVSYDGDCQSYRDREVAAENVPNRNFIPFTPADLESKELHDLWYMGIIVCADEYVQSIAETVSGLTGSIGRDRISLYLGAGVDEKRVIQEWKQAGLGAPAGVYPFDHPEDPWRNFHKRFGNHHAEQVDEDRRRHPNHIQQYASGSEAT